MFPGFCLVLPQICPTFCSSSKTAACGGLKLKLYEGGKNGRQINKPAEDNWNQDCQEAFDSLKQVLTNPPVLAYPIYSKPFNVEVDPFTDPRSRIVRWFASGQTNTLCQLSIGGAERNMDNYPSRKVELLLSLKWTVVTEKFREYLLYSTFTGLTDSNPLAYLQSKTKLRAVEQRWVSELVTSMKSVRSAIVNKSWLRLFVVFFCAEMLQQF